MEESEMRISLSICAYRALAVLKRVVEYPTMRQLGGQRNKWRAIMPSQSNKLIPG